MCVHPFCPWVVLWAQSPKHLMLLQVANCFGSLTINIPSLTGSWESRPCCCQKQHFTPCSVLFPAAPYPAPCSHRYPKNLQVLAPEHPAFLCCCTGRSQESFLLVSEVSALLASSTWSWSASAVLSLAKYPTVCPNSSALFVSRDMPLEVFDMQLQPWNISSNVTFVAFQPTITH